AEAELNVARLDQLQHLRLLAELAAGILVDQHRALAQFLELLGEDVAGDAVARADRLVVGELVVLGLRERVATEGQTGQQGEAGGDPIGTHLEAPLLRSLFARGSHFDTSTTTFSYEIPISSRRSRTP